MSDKKGVCFAPLIRVSTEKQEKRGESLNTQHMQLEQAIKNLNGTIYKWYAGQEHATPDHERKILDELMTDAQAGKFDAVMVTDISRWSRDNQMSKKYLSILKDKQIQFYWLGRNMDLSIPFNNLMIGMGTEINEFVAAEQSYKSIINRIERAKKGIPVAGKLPYGRTYDKKTNKWGVNLDKQAIIKDAAKRYLSGESMDSIAVHHKMNCANLRLILKHRCGDEWTVRFRSKDLKIDETNTIDIPRLLPESIIKEIQERSESNKTYTHGAYKYEYLLSGIIYDKETGYSLTGTSTVKGQRYYRPYRGIKAYRHMINADVLECSFLEGFTDLLNSKNKFMESVFEGNSLRNVTDTLEKKREKIKNEISSLKKKNSNLLCALEFSNEDDAKNFIKQAKEKIIENEKELNEKKFQLDIIENQLNTLPTKKEIEDKREMLIELIKRINESYFRSGLALESLPFSEKKKIINLFFGGQDDEGKKYGIYIQPLGGIPKRYQFKAYGKVGYVDGSVNERYKGYSSFSMPSNNDDDGLYNKTASIMLDANPDLSIKQDMLSLDKATAIRKC